MLRPALRYGERSVTQPHLFTKFNRCFMKVLILSIAAFAFSLSCATAQVDKGIVTKPDLIGNISQSGTNLIITVSNMAQKNPHNASGKARNSSAKLILDGQSQTIQVPELLPDSEFKKAIPIPASLVSKSFAATLIVDAGTVVPESNENNNKFTGTFNAPDLTPLLVNDQVKFREEGAFYYLSVKNIGIAKSGAFSTKVTYQLRNGQTKVVMGLSTDLPIGATIEVRVPAPPPDCFNQDCRFKVEIDPNNAVKELLETNNTATGVRIG